MALLIGIPVPSIEQIIIGTELVFILYIPKKIVSKLDGEFRIERNRIIRNHVKASHAERLRRCGHEACVSLRTPATAHPVLELQPEVLDLQL